MAGGGGVGDALAADGDRVVRDGGAFAWVSGEGVIGAGAVDVGVYVRLIGRRGRRHRLRDRLARIHSGAAGVGGGRGVSAAATR